MADLNVWRHADFKNPSSSGQTINWVEEHSDQRLSVREYLIKDQI